MTIKTEFEPFTPNISNLEFTVTQIKQAIQFDMHDPFFEPQGTQEELDRLVEHYNQLNGVYLAIKEVATILDQSDVERICEELDKIVDLLVLFDVKHANSINDIRLMWDSSTPPPWYQKGKILFQLFVEREVEDLDGIINLFMRIIQMSEDDPNHKDLVFWSYSFLGNIYLYRILTGEEALEQAMKYYNQAYRFAVINEIEVDKSFIFNNMEILQQILMNQHPLLVVIYNHAGLKIYEYLFQFIEVITEDKRFIPNFTALLSAVDDRINELFNSPISDSYIVIQNRIMVISTLYEEPQDDEWIKVALVFSHLQQAGESITIDSTLMKRVQKFNSQIMTNNEIKDYIIGFNGRYDNEIYAKIEEKLLQVFKEVSM